MSSQPGWQDRDAGLEPVLWRQQLIETKQEKTALGTDHSGTERGWDKDCGCLVVVTEHVPSVALADG